MPRESVFQHCGKSKETWNVKTSKNFPLLAIAPIHKRYEIASLRYIIIIFTLNR